MADRAGGVLVVGSLNVDLVTRVRAHPRPGETVAGEGLRRLPGGKGANQALAAAEAGASVRLVGRVGDDAEGAAYLAGLRERGVDVSGVRRSPGLPTGRALVVVDEAGENAIVVVAGANLAVTPADVDAALAGGVPSVLLLQHEVPEAVVAHAARRAAELGSRVVLNPSPVRPVGSGLVGLCDPLVVNEHEARALGGGQGGPAELTPALRERGARSVVLTLGDRGARWDGPTGAFQVAAPRVDPVDTTGAGDAFAGALAAALADGDGPEAALRRAVKAGSAAVAWPGAQPWVL